MSQDPVAAIASSAMQTSVFDRAAQSHPDSVDLHSLAGAHAGGGATVASPQPQEVLAPSAMNLESLATQFADGMQNGFYASDMNRLVDKIALLNTPGSSVAFGDVAMELINVQAKVGIADAFTKVSSKLSEGLQTLVVRQT
jgi:hypothetical protein